MSQRREVLVDTVWGKEFQERMDGFSRRLRSEDSGVPISIKVRVTSGCFHQEHSPRAYEVIERSLARAAKPDFEYVPHESGPELLVFLAVATAGITLAKSIIDLITTIIKARSEGIKKGDQPSDPLELIVRRVDETRQVKEEIVLRIGHREPVDAKIIEKQLTEALQRLTDKRGNRDS